MDPVAPKKSKPYNNYLKYSGLAIQLFGVVGLAGWGGYALDQKFGLSFPAFLLTFVLLAFSVMMYLLYRSINNE